MLLLLLLLLLLLRRDLSSLSTSADAGQRVLQISGLAATAVVVVLPLAEAEVRLRRLVMFRPGSFCSTGNGCPVAGSELILPEERGPVGHPASLRPPQTGRTTEAAVKLVVVAGSSNARRMGRAEMPDKLRRGLRPVAPDSLEGRKG